MRCSEVVNDDSEIVWIGPILVRWDYPFLLILRLEYAEQWLGRDYDWRKSTEYRYQVSVYTASPQYSGPEECEAVCRTLSINPTEFYALPFEWQCVELMHGGLAPRLWVFGSNNLEECKRTGRFWLQRISSDGDLFDEKMNKPQNAMQATGWDWCKGNLNGPYAREKRKTPSPPPIKQVEIRRSGRRIEDVPE